MKIHFVVCAAFAVLALLSPRALPGEELTPADQAQIAAINAELDKLMPEIMAADEAERAKGKRLSLIMSDMALKIQAYILDCAKKDPATLARALERFMLTNPHFLAKKCGDAFRYPYMLLFLCVSFSFGFPIPFRAYCTTIRGFSEEKKAGASKRGNIRAVFLV